MINYEQIQKLLSEKEALFLEVERITDDIYGAPVDMINELLEVRGQALEQIILIDRKLDAISADDEYLKNVLNCTCDMSALSGETKALLEEALRIKSIVNRIIKNEESVRTRIKSERDSLLVKIESLNHSSKAVAESYKRSVETGLPKSFGKKKFKSV